MDLSLLNCRFTTPAQLVLLWAIEQAAAPPDSLSKSNTMDWCEQYFQDGKNLCAKTIMCCQTGMDEYGWIAAAVGWSLWFLTLILVCVNKVAKLRPDEPQKYTSA